MAIVNPNLLVGLDTNGTNQGTPDNALITDGYLFQSIPKSGDMNRYFKELYRAIHFQKESGLWQWDNTVSYSSGARIMRNEVIYKSLQDANQGNDPLSTSLWIIDQWRKQTTTHDMTSDTDYTLTTAQNEFGRIVITDSGVILTATRNIIVDNIEKDFIVQNDTLQGLTVKTSAGAGILVPAGTFKNLYNDDTNIIVGVEDVSPMLSTDRFMHVQDQKPNGTDGGSSVAGFQDRILNTIVENSINGASLSSNLITLPIGKYYLESKSIAYQCNRSKLLISDSANATLLNGDSRYAGAGTGADVQIKATGIIDLLSVTQIKLRDFKQAARATDGYGLATSSGEVEVYSDIKIWKVG